MYIYELFIKRGIVYRPRLCYNAIKLNEMRYALCSDKGSESYRVGRKKAMRNLFAAEYFYYFYFTGFGSK